MQVIISILGDRMRPMQCGLLILQLRFWCHCEERSDEAIYHDRLLRFARNDDDDVQKSEIVVLNHLPKKPDLFEKRFQTDLR